MNKVGKQEVVRFMKECFQTAGACAEAAEQQAILLMEADRCGHYSHGLSRLQRYVIDITNGVCHPNNTPQVLNETSATAWVDANNVLGATAGFFATDIAIKKAKESGVGWVSVKGSNHFGIGGFWASLIAEKGLIGLAFTNGQPLVAPTRGAKAALGSNPVSMVAPGLPKTGHFYLDMATSAVALGKIELARRNRQKLQPGWAQGPDGKETTDADVAFKTLCLMPLGGAEKSGGYKGFGLSALVDILSGMVSGADYGHHVTKWTKTGDNGPANLGHTFIAVNHASFAPGFESRVTDSIEYWRNLTPTDPKYPVLAPGDIEKRTMANTDSTGLIVYDNWLLESIDRLAKKLNVMPLKRENLQE